MTGNKEDKSKFTHEFYVGTKNCIPPWQVQAYIPRLVKLPNGHLKCCCGSTLSKMSLLPRHEITIKHRLATGELVW